MRSLDLAAQGTSWPFKAILEDTHIAGSVIVFPNRHDGEDLFEINAFPTVSNGRPNRICEKNGFTNLGEEDFTYAGRRLRCNRWRIELWPGAETEVRA